MLNSNETNLPLVIIIGEKKGKRVVFGNSFDPSYNHTEGQFRAIHMQLQRLINMSEYTPNSVLTLGNGDEVYITEMTITDRTLLQCVIIIGGKFNEKLVGNIATISQRGGIYTAKRYYNEILELSSGKFDESQINELTAEQSMDILRNREINHTNLSESVPLLQIVSKVPQLFDINIHKRMIEALDCLNETADVDVILDAAYAIANSFVSMRNLVAAKEIYLAISQKSIYSERLALEITCRLMAANIARELNQTPTEILEMLAPIDDGSLEVATQEEREKYYSLNGYCYFRIGDIDLAIDFHQMAVMIGEETTSPSIYIAESRFFLGEHARSNYQPEVATREFLTAAAIARTRKNGLLATDYSHAAAIEEVVWAEYLASSAIIANMNSYRKRAEFYAWQAIKRLINSIIHSDKRKRKTLLEKPVQDVMGKAKAILLQTQSDYALQTISEFENQLKFFFDGMLPSDQELEMLSFISTKVSAMLPLPSLIIMLIATDGRLILGGEIGSDDWDQSIMENDDLFSGALSAIMAILSEVMSDTNPLRMLDAGQTQIMIEKSKVCIGALLVDRDLMIIRKALKDTVEFMEETYPQLEDWDGATIDFSQVKPNVEQRFQRALKQISE